MTQAHKTWLWLFLLFVSMIGWVIVAAAVVCFWSVVQLYISIFEAIVLGAMHA